MVVPPVIVKYLAALDVKCLSRGKREVFGDAECEVK
jgi:hypothetical protein